MIRVRRSRREAFLYDYFAAHGPLTVIDPTLIDAYVSRTGARVAVTDGGRRRCRRLERDIAGCAKAGALVATPDTGAEPVRYRLITAVEAWEYLRYPHEIPVD